jgi:hypothetical protein
MQLVGRADIDHVPGLHQHRAVEAAEQDQPVHRGDDARVRQRRQHVAERAAACPWRTTQQLVKQERAEPAPLEIGPHEHRPLGARAGAGDVEHGEQRVAAAGTRGDHGKREARVPVVARELDCEALGAPRPDSRGVIRARRVAAAAVRG